MRKLPLMQRTSVPLHLLLVNAINFSPGRTDWVILNECLEETGRTLHLTDGQMQWRHPNGVREGRVQ